MDEKITSRENAKIKYACRLSSSAAFRRSEGRFLAEGRKLCPELARGAQLETLFYTEDAMARCPELADLPGEHYLVEDHVADKLADVGTHQGVFGVFRTPVHTLDEVHTGGRYLALERVQDPGNVGTLLRSAAAFGFDGVLLSDGCASVWAPKTLRASMGAAVRIPVIEAGAMPQAVAQLRAKGITCLAAALYQSQPLSAAQSGCPGGVCVVIGSEGQGLTDETIAACTSTVRIPMTDRVESLNAGIAGSILLWHFRPEPAPDPLLCWLWLAHVLGPASPHAGRVLDAFGGAQEAWEARDTQEFRQAAGPAAAKRAGQLVPEQFRALARRCAALRVCILPFDDPDYPLAFSRIQDMPLVLYCTGDPVWLNEPGTVGIVGSRKPTDYGLQAAADIGEALARSGALIVSGLADGLDSAGHRAAVKNGCPTIGILGVPIDRTYPAANVALRHTIEQNGCILSEYAPGESTPGPVGFLQRNRLIAALSSALLVVEAREKSGTMSTVSHAERYGKPVFAVPGSIYSPDSAGTNRLLHEGRARAACSGADLVQALGLQASAAPEAETRQPDPMSDTERRVLACVGPQPLGVEELCVRSGLPTASLLSTLMKLQLTGRVTCLPGKRYVLR